MTRKCFYKCDTLDNFCLEMFSKTCEWLALKMVFFLKKNHIDFQFSFGSSETS